MRLLHGRLNPKIRGLTAFSFIQFGFHIGLNYRELCGLPLGLLGREFKMQDILTSTIFQPLNFYEHANSISKLSSLATL